VRTGYCTQYCTTASTHSQAAHYDKNPRFGLPISSNDSPGHNIPTACTPTISRAVQHGKQCTGNRAYTRMYTLVVRTHVCTQHSCARIDTCHIATSQGGELSTTSTLVGSIGSAINGPFQQTPDCVAKIRSRKYMNCNVYTPTQTPKRPNAHDTDVMYTFDRPEPRPVNTQFVGQMC
jgi:hypothetical protein